MATSRIYPLTDTKNRLLNKMAQINGCWIWQGTERKNGYGGAGKRLSRGKWSTVSAHRLSYETFVGPIPKGLTIDHLCRTKLCINPDHLEAVSQKVNNFRAPNYVGNRTHCPSGHEYSAENTNTSSNRRRCLTCHRLRESQRRLILKGAL